MGLDGIELVMEFEDEFKVKIPDDVAADMRTVGDVVDYIQARQQVRRLPAEVCRTSHAFHVIRRGLCELLSVARRDVAPATRLPMLTLRESRREVWRELRQAGLSLPALRRPQAASWLVAVAVAAAAAGAAALLGDPLILLAVIPLGLIAFYGTRPLADRIPAVSPTVGDLAVYAAAMSAGEAEIPSLRRAEILSRVRVIVAEQLGIPVAEVREASRFIEDLKVDQ